MFIISCDSLTLSDKAALYQLPYLSVQEFEHACVAIHRNLHTRFQQTDVDPADGWLAVLPCTQGTMLEGTTNLQDHCRTTDKQRSPCWIGEHRCQDLAPFESLAGALEHPDNASDDAWRDRGSRKCPRLLLRNIGLEYAGTRVDKEWTYLGLLRMEVLLLPGAQELSQVHGGLAHRLVNLFDLEMEDVTLLVQTVRLQKLRLHRERASPDSGEQLGEEKFRGVSDPRNVIQGLIASADLARFATVGFSQLPLLNLAAFPAQLLRRCLRVFDVAHVVANLFQEQFWSLMVSG
mmetsp:Transcript_14594/g.40107  ORF Transcript_14594/g.40107 Transcript_14594/m.40107 type:complete len:291 (-) Transcript_14594:1930-2802(-)